VVKGVTKSMSESRLPTSRPLFDDTNQPALGGSDIGWAAQVRLLVAAVSPVVLSEFVRRLGSGSRNARKWPESDRIALFRRVCVDSALSLLAIQANKRGLHSPSDWLNVLEVSTELSDAVAKYPVAFVGVAYESFLANVPRFEGSAWVLGNSHDRRTEGTYFTPPSMAAFVAKKALDPIVHEASIERLRGLKVIDPAMGSGAFLIQALHLIAERGRTLGLDNRTASRIALESLYGVDKDPDAVRIGMASLWVEACDASISIESLNARFKVGDALLGPSVCDLSRVGSAPAQLSLVPDSVLRAVDALDEWKRATGVQSGAFDWITSFPQVFLDSAGCRLPRGGFDVVLGNPPWGKIKAELKEYFTALDERVRNLQGTDLRLHVRADSDAEWKAYRDGRISYAETLKSSGTFIHQRLKKSSGRGSGDSDLYKYFMERATQLVNQAGRIGIIIPASFYQSDSASALRELFFDNGEIEHLLCFENRDKVFPIHGMFKYSILIWQRGGRHGIRHAKFNLPRASLLSEVTATHPDDPSMTTEWLRSVSGERLIVPELRNRREQDLYFRLHSSHPALGDTGSSWNVDFVREFDMTNDRALFLDEAQLVRKGARTDDGTIWSDPNGGRFVPLYEGRLVHQFDHAAKSYIGGAGRRARWVPTDFGCKSIRPHFWVAENLRTAALKIRAGFCDITGHGNERTVLAALIPAGFPCGNKVPTVRFDSDDSRLPFLWLAVANSFVIDWIMRRRVSTTINFFHWKMTPFPRLSLDDPRSRMLWTSAAKLCSINSQSASAINEVLIEHGEPIGAPMIDLHERARLRAELDVEVAGLFKLEWTEVALMLGDFPLLDRRQPPALRELNSGITKNLLELAWWRKNRDLTNEQRVEARVLEFRRQGAVGYQPSEHVNC
jgi:hypothetical protein